MTQPSIVVIGDRDTSFLSHREIDATLALIEGRAVVGWLGTDDPRTRDLDDVDGIWLAPGGPYRDPETLRYAVADCLDDDRPLLATCGGFQHTVLELTRRAGVDSAAHAEDDPDAEELVIRPLACALYGETRLVTPRAGSALAAIVGEKPFEGFHFCGYGVDDRYVPALEAAGVVVSATAPDAGVEAVEVPGQSFLLATAFQPQVGASESGRLHPILEAFLVAAGMHRTRSRRLTARS